MINNKHLTAILAFVLVAGMATPAFGQASTAGTPTPGVGAEARITQTAGSTCIVLDFEGVGDFVPAGTIGDITFSAEGVGLVDSDAGGSGNIANEPSPETVLFSPPGSSGIITATLANPVNEISWNYAAPFEPGEIRVFGAGNVLLATIPLPAVAPVNSGDPTGMNFGTWTAGSHTEVGNVITSVEYEGVPNLITWDDLDYCVQNVGGSSMSIDTSALLIAGATANALWIIPTLAGIAGTGFYLVKFRMNKE